MVFLALPYLRELKGATIERVFYGARPGRAATELPVHDLTPFVEVLDWVGAVDGLLQHLDASALTALLAGVQDRAHRERREPPPLHLKPFANNLARFASAVRLARPNEAFLAAHLLLARLDGVEGEIAADLPVLRPLIDRIGRLAPIADDEPALDGDLLRRQRILMRYQLDHGLVLQAVELGREWLVNLLLLRLGCEPEPLARPRPAPHREPDRHRGGARAPARPTMNRPRSRSGSRPCPTPRGSSRSGRRSATSGTTSPTAA